MDQSGDVLDRLTLTEIEEVQRRQGQDMMTQSRRLTNAERAILDLSKHFIETAQKVREIEERFVAGMNGSEEE